MGVLLLTVVLLCLSETLSQDAGEDDLNNIMVEIQPEQEQDIESEVALTQTQVPFVTESDTGCQADVCNLLKRLEAMETRLTSTENQVEELRDIQVTVALLQRMTQDQDAKIRSMETKLSTTQSLMEFMKTVNEAQERKLQLLSFRSNATEFRMNHQQYLMEKLRKVIEDAPKVAFSAALGGDGHIPSSERETNLAFSNVFTNVGNAYNPASGVFDAPVRGVYYFSFSSFAYSERSVCISLFKNNMRMLSACDHHSDSDNSDSSGNGGTLHLEEGDHVYMTLHAHSHIYADYHNRSTFRGFLLFTT
ncbi:hypothetical protein UPYG_G00236750 [Umbra pygmaea]|uniref:C1q domain-containing protein n=1 Tax=Umbra pygmaea TaxID=75934 RepID=A0ABD0WJT0_UMBPY